MNPQILTKLYEACKMINAQAPNRSHLDWATGHMFCLVEEVGEVIDAYESKDNLAEVLLELADVVISANMVAITLDGKPVRAKLPSVSPLTIHEGLFWLAADVARAAGHWRKVSGLRTRASRTPSTMDDLRASLGIAVGRAYTVIPYADLPVAEKLDIVLTRGSGLSEAERRGIRELKPHTGGTPGTVHMYGA
jgi:hypothetical protein